MQSEIFNRVVESLKPGVTVGELAELTKKTAGRRRETGPAAGARGISTCTAAARVMMDRSSRRTPRARASGGADARE